MSRALVLILIGLLLVPVGAGGPVEEMSAAAASEASYVPTWACATPLPSCPEWLTRVDGGLQGWDVLLDSRLADGGDVLVAAGHVAAHRDGQGAPRTDLLVLGMDPETGDEAWRIQVDGTWHMDDYATALALSPDGARAYVAGTSSVHDADLNRRIVGVLFAIDVSTGEVLWERRVVDDDPSGIVVSPDGSLVALAWARVDLMGRPFSGVEVVAYSSEDGALRWSTRFPAGQPLMPARPVDGLALGDRIYLAAGEPVLDVTRSPTLHVIALATENGTLMAHTTVPGAGTAGTWGGRLGAVEDEGRLAFAGSGVIGFDLATLEPVWSRPTRQSVTGVVAVGRSFVVSHYDSESTETFALDVAGADIWRKTIPSGLAFGIGPYFRRIVADGSTVGFVGSSGGVPSQTDVEVLLQDARDGATLRRLHVDVAPGITGAAGNAEGQVRGGGIAADLGGSLAFLPGGRLLVGGTIHDGCYEAGSASCSRADWGLMMLPSPSALESALAEPKVSLSG